MPQTLVVWPYSGNAQSIEYGILSPARPLPGPRAGFFLPVTNRNNSWVYTAGVWRYIQAIPATSKGKDMELPEMATDIVINGQGFSFDETDLCVDFIIQVAVFQKKSLKIECRGEVHEGLGVNSARDIIDCLGY